MTESLTTQAAQAGGEASTIEARSKALKAEVARLDLMVKTLNAAADKLSPQEK